MNPPRPNLDIFADTLLELAQQDRDIVVVTSDSRGSGKLTRFGQVLPDQLIEVGIAEQNLVGVAAGLAASGKKVFAVSPACFLTARSFEQIKNDVAYSNHPVRLVGISAGVSYGALGSTHHSLHDFAALRAVHNLTILAPADNHETRQAILAAADSNSPLYLRFGKAAVPHVHPPDQPFAIGRAITARPGRDLTFVACGETVSIAVQAAELLAADRLDCRVISMHTLKPLDEDALQQAAEETHAILTLEEHSIHGGLGAACAAVLMQHGMRCGFKIVGIPDEHTVTGSQKEIFKHYGITAEGLAAVAKQIGGKSR